MSSIAPQSRSAWSPRSPAERILMQLKMHGEQTAVSLGDRLGTSGEAARQQLVRLSEEGLVASRSQSAGVGRPSQIWDLTERGQLRFPDTHARLTVDLLDVIGETLGPGGLDKIIEAREVKTRQAYAAELAGATTLEARVARLAEIRTREGYMASWEPDGQGGYMLYENHCPICAAAAACQNFCRAEKSVFSEVLGPDVAIDRVEHILSGARRCAYRIQPAA